MALGSQYAVLLREAGQPRAEAVRRAFGVFSHLTEADAIRLAANAQGILQRHLGVDEAKALQRALQAEGVSAALVKEEDLGFLPASQLLQRIELTAEALVHHDLRGRAQAVAWAEVSLVAAGAVPHVEISSTPTAAGGFGWWPRSAGGVRSRLETERHYLLELVVGGGAARYEVRAHQFPVVLGPEQRAGSALEKFVWLGRECVRRAPQALLNRGAADIREGVQLVRGYASEQMLRDEMVWLLWSLRQPPRAGGVHSSSSSNKSLP